MIFNLRFVLLSELSCLLALVSLFYFFSVSFYIEMRELVVNKIEIAYFLEEMCVKIYFYRQPQHHRQIESPKSRKI